MKLTESAFTVLKTFATINNNIVIEPGKIVRTSNAPQNTVFVNTELEDFEFPSEVRIYNLNEFLNVVNLLGGIEKCDLTFEDNRILLKNTGSKSKVTYWYASRNVLLFPEKNINMPDPAVSFELTSEMLTQLKKASATFGHPYMSLYNTEDSPKHILGKVYDPEVKTSNMFEVEASQLEDDSSDVIFDYIFSVNHVKTMMFDPEVKTIKVDLASKGKAKIARFVGGSLTYYVAVESTSTINQ